jgi:tetratricopeptide (TPR) repeat protein
VSIPTVQNFTQLVSSPIELKHFIETHRERLDLDESVLGFIALYDSLDGDCSALERLLNENKSHILKPLSTANKRFFIPNLLRYAALFSVLLLSSVFTYLQYFQQRPFTISTSYKDPGIPTFMENSAANSLESIMFYYRKDAYPKAHELVEIALQKNPENDTLVYYSAVLNQLTAHNQLAKVGFMKLRDKGSVFSDKAMYFLAICYVSEEKYAQAIALFEKVIQSNDESLIAYSKEHTKALRAYLKRH